MDPRRKRLHRILELRRHDEQLKRQEFAIRLGAEREARREADAAAARVGRVLERLAMRFEGGAFAPLELLDLEAEARFEESRARGAVQRLREAGEARRKAEDSWKTSRQGKRSLERLDEKWGAAEVLRTRRAEQKILDEVALRRFVTPGAGTSRGSEEAS